MPALCEIELLGSLRARLGDRVITRFSTHKTAALLAYLAYHAEQSHPREVLTTLLWPDAEPQTSRVRLSSALSSLRRQLEPPGILPSTILQADRSSVGLNAAVLVTDVAQFAAACSAAAQAGSTTERIQALTQAVNLYHGELLPGFYEEWVPVEQRRLAELYFQAVRQLTGLLEKTQDLDRALEHVRRAVSLDPYREEAHQLAMRLYTAAGQPAAALEQYREMERLFQEHLGVELSSASRQFARSLQNRAGNLSSPPSASPPPSPRPVPTAVTGTVLTFLLTDIAGAAALQERTGDRFRSALQTHHALLRRTFEAYHGQEVKETGDAFLVAFTSPTDALACALAGQQALLAHPWPPEIGTLHVRMALHSGEVKEENGQVYGLALHRASRMLSAAHGGQILCSQTTAELLRRDLDPQVRLADLGVYRLRDVAEPERLFRVEHPDLAQRVFPPLNAAAGYRSHLPLQMTRFFGREPEITRLVELLSPPTHFSPAHLLTRSPVQLVTITGPGGTGKTRLSIEVAGRLSAAFSGAVWFVPLADLTDAGRIAGTIVDALSLPRSDKIKPLEQALEALSKQPALLILDNFEHLVEAGASLVKTLLERIPSLMLLITSRRLLNLSVEREFPLQPLPTPNGPDTPERLTMYESVRLFIDRAQAVRPDFQVTNHNAPAVAGICDRLEGIPLAIELAAARSLTLPPGQILTQLVNRFAFLVSKQRDVSERHRSLRAAIDWSYHLLSPEIQRFFARLSVFRGGWTLEAAEAVCEEPTALDFLEHLRECSLVLVEEGKTGMRFRMLETLREYAWEQLAEDSQASRNRYAAYYQERHRDYFLGIAEAAEQQLNGPEQAAWLSCLDGEYDNLQAALSWCQAEKKSADTELRLAGALCRFWNMRGYGRMAWTYLTEALSREGAQARTQWRAKALYGAGMIANNISSYAVAQVYFEESLAIFRELGDKPGTANALIFLGRMVGDQGDYAAAQTLFEESLAIFRESDDKQGIANALYYLGGFFYNRGDFVEARAYFEESLRLYREVGNPSRIAMMLHGLGDVYKEQGNYATARSLYEEALALSRQIGNQGWQVNHLAQLGLVVVQQGDYSQAQRFWEEGLAIAREVGYKFGIGVTLHYLGASALYQELYTRAQMLLEESLVIHREIGDQQKIAVSLSSLADLAWHQGDYVQARAYRTESLMIWRKLGKYGIAESLEGFGNLTVAEGQFERAAQLWGAAEALREAIGSPLSPLKRENYIYRLDVVRKTLGEEAFAVAWEAGRAMTWEQAVAYALEETQMPSATN